MQDDFYSNGNRKNIFKLRIDPEKPALIAFLNF